MTAAACCPHCGLDPAAPSADKPKGGKLSRAAALLCKDQQFRLYLDLRARTKYRLKTPDGSHTEEDARVFILKTCSVRSRAELDSSAVAAQWFARIQAAYAKHRRQLAQQRG